MPTELLLVGAGGHGRVVADAALRLGWSCVATDGAVERCQGELLPGVPVLTPQAALAWLQADPARQIHVAIGDAGGRQHMSQRYQLGPQAEHAAAVWAVVLHPDASVSRYAALAPGCFVAAQAVLAPGACLAQGVILNHGAVIDHDSRVGAWSHVAPGVTVAGGATVGQRVLLGAGCRVLPGLTVADGVTVGAGAVVCRDLLQPGTYLGVPARRIE